MTECTPDDVTRHPMSLPLLPHRCQGNQRHMQPASLGQWHRTLADPSPTIGLMPLLMVMQVIVACWRRAIKTRHLSTNGHVARGALLAATVAVYLAQESQAIEWL